MGWCWCWLVFWGRELSVGLVFAFWDGVLLLTFLRVSFVLCDAASGVARMMIVFLPLIAILLSC